MKSYRLLAPVALIALALAVSVRVHAQDYTITTISNAIVVTDVAGNADVLTVSEPVGGAILFAAPGRLFRVNAGIITTNESEVLSRTNAISITINAGAGADMINFGGFTGNMPSLTINGGTGDDTVLFFGDLTFAANANLDVDLQNDSVTPGVDAVQLLSDANLLASGSGAITVKCSKSIFLDPGSSLETVNGNLTVEANQQATPTSGNFAGFGIYGGLLRCTGSGLVGVRGRGGNEAGGYQLGVIVDGAGQIIGGASGVLTVVGTGGDGVGLVNRGVTVYGTGALISSLGGPVQVTGQGGSLGSDYGIGVALLYGGVISAGGTGSVTVEGTGAGFGGANQGIEMGVDGSAITSSGGNIQVIGTAGPGDSYGITASDSVGFTNAAAGGAITLIADSILLENNVGVVASGVGGSITIKPKNNGTLIDLGGADVAGTLGLTDEELDFITAGALVIGSTNAGSITVSAPISPASAAALTLVSGGAIGDSYNGAVDVTVASLTTIGNLAPGASPGIFIVAGDHTLAANSAFTVEIGGAAPGTQHDQLSVGGSMEIGTNVTLNLVSFGGFVPSAGQNFTIISRGDGGGLFAGLPQGATLANFLGSGLNARLTYNGGGGDDVVIAMLAPEIVVEQPEGTNLNDGIVIDQYADTVLDFSSAYGGLDGGWGANQVLGVPDTFAYGDISTAWSGDTIDGTLEYITVGFAMPVYATGVTVRETWANGFVYQIDVVDMDDVLHTVWTGIDPSPPGSPVDFLITWTTTPYLVKGVKVYVDTDHVLDEWEEIDSIQLHGISISDVNFGTINLGGSTNLTFTIRNTGNADLTGLGITIDGANAGDFAVTANPTAPVSGPEGTTTFTITFTPAGGGARSATLRIGSNDSDENPFDIELAGEGIPPVAIVTNGSTLAAESCGTPNGRLDPNETVTVLFSLQNLGFDNAVNVTATLEESGGVVAPGGAQSYGTLAPNGSAARPFTFTVNAPCGGTVTATLQIENDGTNFGTATYSFPVGSIAIIFQENFDAVAAPGLPPGWATSAGDGQPAWVTSSNQNETPLNAAFSPTQIEVGGGELPQALLPGLSELVSPVIAIQSSSARLTFTQFYDLDEGFDGGVLEIRMGEGPFEDILAAGGSFADGGYTTTLDSETDNPLAGRDAWSGNEGEGGFFPFVTTVNLPPAAAGQVIQLRWLRGSAADVNSTGWYVDDIAISELTCCITPPLTITCPGDIVTNAPNVTDGVIVAWPDPVATGTPAPGVSCVPPSGSAFLAGVTTVTCTATNIQGIDSCTFSVTVCPAYIQVTNGEDSGPGSLRQAAADLCPGGTIEFDPALAGATITLINGAIVITNDMTIRGLGADQLTVSGNNLGRVFRINGATVHLSHLTLTDGYASSLTNASSLESGGAILNDGNLTLLNCALSYNFAPGYGGALAGGPKAGTCTISNCTFNGNTAVRGGGAVFAGVVLPPDSVTYEMLGRASTYSSVNVNSLGRAWDIVMPGATVTLTAAYEASYTDGGDCPGCITQHHLGINDVFNDCHDASFGSSTGAISRIFSAPMTPGVYYITQIATWWFFCGQFDIPEFPNDPGSAVALIIVGSPTNAASTVTIHNSTFSGNFADQTGGALDINAYATVNMGNSTVSDNLAPEGGGVNVVAPDGQFIARNVIVAGNSAPTYFTSAGGPPAFEGFSFDVKGIISSAGHNLIGTSEGASGFVASDIVDTNALLGPLQNNGGPTLTHAPLPGSPALDAGDNAGTPAFDQRGRPRIVSGTIDIGAHEAELPAPMILVDGIEPLDIDVLVTNLAVIEIQSGLVGGTIRYTLDGAPPAGGILYTGAFVVTQPVLVRAVGVTADLSLSAESDEIFIEVVMAPFITAQPAGFMAGTGADALLSVTAGGTEPLSYQWWQSGIEVPGATGPVLPLPGIQPAQAGSYTVIIANDYGAVTSSVASVVVSAGPAFITQPANVTVGLGGTAIFTVVASGPPPLLYQWRKNGANILGATNDTLVITNVQFDDGASYSVVIATPGGTLVSDPALLIVTAPSPPPGDDYADATPLPGANGSATGTNNFTTREPGEPLHAGKPGSNSIWYAWTAPAKGIATFRTTGSTFDTLMGIYTGTNVANLTTVVSDEDGGGFLASRVSFNARAGTVYYIALDGLNGQQGSFVLRWEFAPTDSNVAEIECAPASLTVLPGQDATFTVRATGPSLTYQWVFNGEDIWGATQSNYTRINVQTKHVGFYSVRITSTATQTVESAAALLEIGLDPALQSRDKPDDVDAICLGSFAPAAGASSVAMGSVGYQILVGSSTNNLIDCNTTNCGGIPTGSRYLELQPSAAGTFILDTEGSASRTKLWVCRGGSNNLDKTRTYLTCDVDSAPDGRSTVSFAAEAGRTYQVWISKLDTTNGVLQLNWKLGLPPRIASLSSNRFVLEGTTTTLSVTATNIVAAGVPATNALSAPSYTWYFNGTIPLATGPILTLNNLTPNSAGQYMAVAGNEVGSTSAVVRVEIFSPVDAVVVNSGGFTELFADATTSACGSTAARYQWRRNGTVLTGQTNRNLRLQGVLPTQAGQYSVTVSNCFGAATYAVATVAVTVDVGFTAQIEGDRVILSWLATPGKRYRVEHRATPDSGSWAAFQPDLTATTSIMTFADALGELPRYYRVVLLD